MGGGRAEVLVVVHVCWGQTEPLYSDGGMGDVVVVKLNKALSYPPGAQTYLLEVAFVFGALVAGTKLVGCGGWMEMKEDGGSDSRHYEGLDIREAVLGRGIDFLWEKNQPVEAKEEAVVAYGPGNYVHHRLPVFPDDCFHVHFVGGNRAHFFSCWCAPN